MAKFSERFQMRSEDWKKFGTEILTKMYPYLIVLIPVAISQLPPEASYTVIAVWILQRLQTLLTLWISKHKI